MDIKVKEKGWIERLFSRESDLVEEEALLVEGLGWILFRVENNNGTITVWLSKEKIEEFPLEDEEWERVSEKLVSCKLLFFGSFGPTEEGKGCLYTNIVKGTYQDKTPFETFDKGNEVLEEYLNRYKTD